MGEILTLEAGIVGGVAEGSMHHVERGVDVFDTLRVGNGFDFAHHGSGFTLADEGVDVFPHDFLVLGHFKDVAVGGGGDEGVAVGQVLGGPLIGAVEGVQVLGSVFPFDLVGLDIDDLIKLQQ